MNLDLKQPQLQDLTMKKSVSVYHIESPEEYRIVNFLPTWENNELALKWKKYIFGWLPSFQWVVHYEEKFHTPLSNDVSKPKRKYKVPTASQHPVLTQTHYYKLCVNNNKVSWITDEGEESSCCVNSWEKRTQTVVAERLYLYYTIFWNDVNHLMFPWSPKRNCQVKYHQTLQKLVQLEISAEGNVSEKAELCTETRRVMFGCESFPGDFIGNTLKKWKHSPMHLEEIIIGWRVPMENRRQKMETLISQRLNNEMKHIWNPSIHSESLFANTKITRLNKELAKHPNEETEKCVDMYLLYSESGTHIAVLSITDVSVSIHCGLKEGKWVVPIFKQAFEFVTHLEHDYYEIIKERVPRAPLQT